jgi:hypothetical protein
MRLLALALLLLATPAMAGPAVINLSCDGEINTGADQKESVKKIGLVVNLAQHSVSGFPVVAGIDTVDDALISFSGAKGDALGTSRVEGTIDRVTGAAVVSTTLFAKDGKLIATQGWDLVCKVTNRLF